MIYSKLPISFDDQINQLKNRGLRFDNEASAKKYLSNISYYRLRAYTYPFQDNNNQTHPFIKDLSFEDIISLYVFDRRLRLILLNAIEKIEIALRTKIVYHFALKYGSHWHENSSIYRNPSRFYKEISTLYEEIDRSTETFIQHYKDKYNEPENPPSWMSLEVASFGLLSKLFVNLSKGVEKNQVTKDFGLKKVDILESWMHTFANLRNICAHHGRIWNRRYTIKPKLPYDTNFPFVDINRIYPNKLYASICCIYYIVKIISPQSDFKTKLIELIDSCHMVDLKEMGFPANWKTEPLWTS